MAIKISNIQGYALISSAANVHVSKVFGYAMAAKNPSTLLRTVFGYAMTGGVGFPKGITGVMALMAMILKVSKPTRPATHFILSTPEINDPADKVHNSKVKLAPTPLALLSGSMYFYYNRVPIDYITATPDKFQLPTVTTISGLLTALNDYTGVLLAPEDIVDGPIAPNSAGIVLTAAATSCFFIPGSVIILGAITLLSAQFTSDTIHTAFNYAVAGSVGLLPRINAEQGRSFTYTQISFSTASVLVSDPTYNTTVTLTSIAPNLYIGDEVVKYNRVSLATAFSGKALRIPMAFTDSYSALDAINTQFGIMLEQADLINSNIDPAATSFVLTVADGSVYFLPGSSVTFVDGKPLLTDVVPQSELSGFSLR